MKKKNSKIKQFFKDAFSTRKTKIAFFTCVLSCLLLISVTFAWFYSRIELPQSQISTGTIDYVVKGYDVDGKFISTIVDPEKVNEDTVNPNVPLLNLQNITVNNYTTAYISIETTGTLDMEYSFGLKVSGSEADLKNIGGFWFKIEELVLDYNGITDSNNKKIGDEGYNANLVDYSSIIAPYATSNGKIVECSSSCIDGTGDTCTEHNVFSRNLIIANSFAVYGELKGNKKVAFYRIDVGLKNTSTPERYAGTNLTISGAVYGTQIGGINGENGYGNVYKVTDSQTLQNAIENALPGDTIQLMSNIVYHGDLVFNKCISLVTYGHNLTIYGNLVYDFTSSHTLKLNLASGGSISVLMENGAGGDFQINTPNSNVQITGNNYTTNISVEDRAVFNVSNALNTAGMLISGANILSKDGVPKDVYIGSNSRLTLDYGASLESIEALANSSNIEIINYGTIEDIFLSNMLLIDAHPEIGLVDTGAPQILISNYAKIVEPIQLPMWARPYVLEPNSEGYYEGNTLIYRQLGAEEMNIYESLCVYQKHHIIDFNKKDVCVVQKVSGKNDGLIVFYGNRLDEDGNVEITSISSLLIEYFKEYYNNAISNEQALEYIANVTYLEVMSLSDIASEDNSAKLITDKDFEFMNVTMERLSSIDLSQASTVNNAIPEKAFYNKTTLKSFVLPNNISRLENNAFYGTSINQIRIPASITYYHMNAIVTIQHVFLDSLVPVVPTGHSNTNIKTLNVYVNEAAIEAYHQKWLYKETIGTYTRSRRVHVDGIVTDDGLHVVREGSGGYELINYVGSGGDLKIGHGLTINGTPITITTVKAFAYTNVPSTFTAAFEPTISTIEEFAFYNSLVSGVDFNNVLNIGMYAFRSCTKLTYIDFENVQTIEQGGFVGSTNIFEIYAPNLEYIGTSGFEQCFYLSRVTFGKIKTIEYNAFYMYNGTFGHVSNLTYMTFENESFDDCTFSSISGLHIRNPYFRIFVREELIDQFKALNFVVNQSYMVYPIGDIAGELIYSRTTSDGVYCSTNLGQMVVSKDSDNVKLICYNAINITEDFVVPDKATVKYADGSTVVKTIASVGKSAFQRVKFEKVKVSFPDSITRVEDRAFYQYSNDQTNGYYTYLSAVDFNKVKFVGQYAFASLTYLTNVEGEYIEEIEAYAFNKCTRLFSVNLPAIKILGEVDQAENGMFAGCTNLVSVRLGKNLEQIYGKNFIDNTVKKLRELVIEAEITSKNYQQFVFQDSYSANNSDFRIFVPQSVIDEQNSTYAQFYREYGEIYGERIIYNSDETLSINIGEYRIKECTVDDTEGISICSYNYTSCQPGYTIPIELNGKNVIRFGHNCFRKISFANVTPINDAGEHFEFSEYVLELGSCAFAENNVRFSKMPSVKYMGNGTLCKNTNIYLIDAPNLLKVGNNILEECANIKIVYARKLEEVGENFLYKTAPIAVYTNVKISGNANWLSNNSIKYIELAMDDDSDLVINSGKISDSAQRAIIANSVAAANYYNTNYSYGVFSKEEFIRVSPFTYYIKDEYDNVIYTSELYEYLINKNGTTVSIYKCLRQEYTEDVHIPSILDDRTVTMIDFLAFSSVNFNYNQVSFGDTITYIDNGAFSNCYIGGTLNLNNIDTVYVNGFLNNVYDTLVAPNLVTVYNNCFGKNTYLTSVYLPKISKIDAGVFQNCTNLTYIYFETMPTISAWNAFALKTNITVVMNIEVTSTTEIKTSFWNGCSNVLMYVPYNSLSYYESVFEAGTAYKNFTVEPYGIILDDVETGNIFMFEEVQGAYIFDEETQTGTYETVYKLNMCNTTLERVEIPSIYNGIKVTMIGENAFMGQLTITTLVLPKHLYNFGSETLHTIPNLQSLEIADDADNFATVDGVLYTKTFKDLVHYPKGKADSSYTIIDGTQIIRPNAFKDAMYLEELVVPSSVIIIGDLAFDSSKITSITFKALSAPHIVGNTIFSGDSSLLVITVPKNSISTYRTSSAFAYMNLVEAS